MNDSKFCEHCGNKIHSDAVICPSCGVQLKELKSNNENKKTTIINNYGVKGNKECDKWISFLLCFFLGFIGAHKFYEGKIGLGILYIFTIGLFGIGVLVDLIVILCKENPYYV